MSGFVVAPGNMYKMYEIPFSKMLQPRLGATWAYNGKDTVYASYARYNPAASSLPRAASWARNLGGASIDAFFDQNGVLYGSRQVASLVGKLFVEDMTPRTIDEFMSAPLARSTRTGRDASTGAIARAATSGKTRTTTRASRSTRRPAFRESSTSPTSRRSSRRSAADRPT